MMMECVERVLIPKIEKEPLILVVFPERTSSKANSIAMVSVYSITGRESF